MSYSSKYNRDELSLKYELQSIQTSIAYHKRRIKEEEIKKNKIIKLLDGKYKPCPK